MKYLVVIRNMGRDWSGYAPDVPGVVATGNDEQEVIARMRVALGMRLRGMQREGRALPQPQTVHVLIDVDVD